MKVSLVTLTLISLVLLTTTNVEGIESEVAESRNFRPAALQR